MEGAQASLWLWLSIPLRIAWSGRVESSAPAQVVAIGACFALPLPGLHAVLSLLRQQRGSFWLWQENRGPGRRGGYSRKLNTMTI